MKFLKHCFVLSCRVLKHNWPHNWLHATFRGRNCSISKEMALRLVLLLSLFSIFTFAKKHYLVEVEEGAGDHGDADDGDNVEAPGDDAKAPAAEDYLHLESYSICGDFFGPCRG